MGCRSYRPALGSYRPPHRTVLADVVHLQLLRVPPCIVGRDPRKELDVVTCMVLGQLDRARPPGLLRGRGEQRGGGEGSSGVLLGQHDRAGPPGLL